MNNQNVAHYKLVRSNSIEDVLVKFTSSVQAKSKQKRIQASKEAFELYQIEVIILLYDKA